MKLTFLGTGAAEGIPALFCNCAVCSAARASGHMHTRSQILVDRELLIDFPPDSYYRALRASIPLADIRTVLITHSHSDHFYPEDFVMRGAESSYLLTHKLTVYGNRTIADRLRAISAALPSGLADEKPIGTKNGYIVYPQSTEYVVLAPFDRTTDGKYSFIALPARHIPGEDCFMYLLSDGVRNILCTGDTAYPSAEVLDFLQAEGKLFDAVVYDGTFGLQTPGYGHMCLSENRLLKAELRQRGLTDELTRHILTHISHNVARNFSDFLCEAQKDFYVASDGDIFTV